MELKTVKDIGNLSDKRVLLRIDTDVEIENGLVNDETRLVASLPTIQYLLQKGAKVIAIGHLGRPTAGYDEKLSLRPVANWFWEKLGGISVENITLDGFPAFSITSNFFLLENIRFYKEEENISMTSGQEFIEKLAALGDIFINEAFAVCHRNHASVAGLTKILPSYAGFHLEKEIETLDSLIKNPKRPLVVLIGGAKIETKLPMVEKMNKIADYILVGGEIAEQDKVLIKVQHEKIEGQKSVILVADNKENGKDITNKSVENFIQLINIGKSIVWNGPVGETAKDPINEEGTKKLAEAIVQTDAYTVVGGGDTIAYLNKIGIVGRFNFVSIGGGAMLEFLSGKELPGITPLLRVA